MSRPAIQLEGYPAFLLIACWIFDAVRADFNFGYHLFVPIAPVDRGFLSPIEAGIDGQAAFCFSAAGQGVAAARLALRVIAL